MRSIVYGIKCFEHTSLLGPLLRIPCITSSHYRTICVTRTAGRGFNLTNPRGGSRWGRPPNVSKTPDFFTLHPTRYMLHVCCRCNSTRNGCSCHCETFTIDRQRITILRYHWICQAPGGVCIPDSTCLTHVTIVPHRITWSWYTGRWWTGCYIWYSEERTGRAAVYPGPSSLYEM